MALNSSGQHAQLANNRILKKRNDFLKKAIHNFYRHRLVKKTRPALRILTEVTLEAKFRLKKSQKWPLRPAYPTHIVNHHFPHTQIRPAISIVT